MQILTVIVLLFLNETLVADNAIKSTIDSEASYSLSTGDRIRIEVYGEDDLKREATLTDNGKISYPFLGELLLQGLTIRELEDLITAGLKGSYLINPEVNVSVLEYRPFFINGEIQRSGSYPYQPGLTLRKAIALAGGFTEYAFQEKITVLSENNSSKIPIIVNFDYKISPGDIITVAEYRRVFINGQVKNPGSYPFQSGLTLRKIIALAGGFGERANRDAGYVISDGADNQAAKEIKLEDMVSPGDIITIKQSFF